MYERNNWLRKEKTEYLDTLTGLPNRRYLYQYFSRNINEFILVFLDIDNFRVINDLHGHRVGDEFLIVFGDILTDIIGENGIVFMYSKDEFIVLLPKNNLDCIDEKVNLILKKVQNGLKVKGYNISTTVSIGICIPQDNDKIDDVIRKANIAICQAKRNGKAQCVYFQKNMEEKIQRKALITEELIKSIDRKELYLVYQPIFDAGKKKTVEVEALIRWNNSKLGQVSPAEFIPIAEETGFIDKLGLWVLQKVCRQIKKWNNQNIDVTVAVNISPNQFKDNGFLMNVRNLVNNERVNLSKIKFEITETQILELTEADIKKLEELIEAGLIISLDDFGSGYSSLRTLACFPISEIKIDKSFIDYLTIDKRMESLISSIISTAHKLGYKVTAEGVEHKEQFNKLLEYKCDRIQGYYIARPMPKEEIEIFIRDYI